MPRHLLRAVFLLALFAGTLGVAAPAALAVDTPFSVRFAQTMRGSINAVGNQLLTCPAAAAGCTDARNRVGTETTLNNNYNMGYVDVDGDASTFNSSTSTLSLPAGATVVWAGLYWGADTQIGSGGASAAPNAANRGSVRFKVGPGSYQTVTAAPADVLTSTGKATRYRGFANVTALVPAGGQRHLHGGQRPDRPRRRPLRGLVAGRRLPGRDAGRPPGQRLRRPRHGRPDAHVLHRHHAVLHAAERHGRHEDRPARVRGRHGHRRRDGDVQRRPTSPTRSTGPATS